MSAFTTLKITRKKAIETMLSKIAAGLTDAELEEYMDRILRDRLYNTRIASDGTPDNDDDRV